MKQNLMELKRELDRSKIVVGDFMTQLIRMERTTRQKIIKEREDSSNVINQLDLRVICRTLYPIRTAYTFFSSTHGTFSKIDHMLCRKYVSTDSKR